MTFLSLEKTISNFELIAIIKLSSKTFKTYLQGCLEKKVFVSSN